MDLTERFCPPGNFRSNLKNEQVPKLGTFHLARLQDGCILMRIISRKTLKEFWDREPHAQGELEAWHAEAKEANWTTPAEVKAHYGNASILRDGRVVFNICGNRYRLIVWINNAFFTIYIRFVGAHAEYNEIDAQTV